MSVKLSEPRAVSTDWNRAIEAAVEIIQPHGHEGDRTCRQVAAAVLALRNEASDSPREIALRLADKAFDKAKAKGRQVAMLDAIGEAVRAEERRAA